MSSKKSGFSVELQSLIYVKMAKTENVISTEGRNRIEPMETEFQVFRECKQDFSLRYTTVEMMPSFKLCSSPTKSLTSSLRRLKYGNMYAFRRFLPEKEP